MGKLAARPQTRPDARRLLVRLKRRQKKLAARLAALDAEISRLAPTHSGKRRPTADDFDRWFRELTEGLPDLPPLPPDFSRADLYDDHD